MKTASRILYENNIDLTILDDDFNTNLLNSMEEYKKQATPDAEKMASIQCKCKDEDKHGETSIMCCNDCGLPTEKFWDVV